MTPKKNRFIRDTFRFSILEGVFVQIYSGLALGVFATKFALMLKATPFQFGLLSAIGQFASIFQLFGIAISNRVSSIKKTIIKASIIARITPLLWGAIPFFVPEQYAVLMFLIFSFINTSISTVLGNMWVEWIASSVPRRIRGRFFSVRQQYLIVAGVIVGFIFSIVIDSFHQETLFSRFVAAIIPVGSLFSESNLPYAFLFIFALGVAFGLTGLNLLHYQPEKQRKEIKTIQFNSLKESLKDKNFLALIVFSFWWMAATGIGSPFWTPYMIDKLKMTLFEVQIYGLISSISSLLFLRFWGRMMDIHGNKPVMFILIIIGAINPFAWYFTNENGYFVVYLEAITSGMMWSGAGIVSMNFSLSVAPKSLRQLYAGFYGAVGGLAMTVTSLMSGKFFPSPMMVLKRQLHPEQVLFLITGFARLTAIIPLYFIKETGTRANFYNMTQLNQLIKVKILRFGNWFYNRFKISP